ncbi:predicted beta-lactamase [Alteracholeplasma palmae J233]|uniref:Predicted beta-lactamase n=1 Tax=Alteracholeplasma palmae (strain ATCC 49389 / J233) TaxID=1318466 RepID=U4KLA0_ALTPJ|nr:serine hydrolase domain-containing protein [Alteracholeplasma palmae]CCV64553.1 predicted beta-lactamase [Alteracholeplasma palmae J233]
MIENMNISFLDRLKEENLPIHGIIVEQDDKVLLEKYYEPFNKHTMHRMYSVTKTFVMLAVGLLYTQKKLKLEDKIYQYFSFDVKHEMIKKMTVKDLLTMQTSFLSTTYKRSTKDYLESFFTLEPEKEPGTLFAYDTSASYVLSALVESITQMDMLEYLKIEILNDLGFTKESYIIKTYEGISHGGSGLMCRLEDLFKVGNFIKNLGRSNHKQYIDIDYMKQAISKQTDTFLATEGPDFRYGYGYQLWKNRYGGFTLFGMGGQIYYYNPIKNMSLTVYADLQSIQSGSQKIIDLFNNFFDKKEQNTKKYFLIDKRISNNNNFSKLYQDDKNRVFLEIIEDKAHINLNGIEINFSTSNYSKGILENKYPYIAYANEKEKGLNLTVYLIGENLGTILMDIYYDKDLISIYSKGYAETILNHFNLNINIRNEEK